MTIKEIKNKIIDTLETEIAKLDTVCQLPVEVPISIEDYKLNHPKGAYLVVYRGGNFSKTKVAQAIRQDRDLEFGIITVIRNTAKGMLPEEYVEFAIESLSGLEIETPRAERLAYVISDEWIKEENGIWWYAVTLTVPVDFLETKYRAKPEVEDED